MKQIRSVIDERLEEDRRDRVAIAQRQTQGVMVAVHAAAGNQRGMKAAADWQLFPGYLRPATQEKELPSTEAAISQLGLGAPQFAWSEVEALAATMRGGTGT